MQTCVASVSLTEQVRAPETRLLFRAKLTVSFVRSLSWHKSVSRRLTRYETPVEISFISRIMRFHAVPVSGGLEGAVRSGERPSALGELSRFSIAQASYVFTSRQLER